MFGEKSSAYSIGCWGGYEPAREYNMRSRLDNELRLPTDERVFGAPRCCRSATAGRSPSIESTAGTPTWSIRRRA